MINSAMTGTMDCVNAGRDARAMIEAALAILDQGIELLNTVDDEGYDRRIAVAFNASLGGHYRHCLDHFLSLMRGLDSGLVDYDRRARDPRLETDRAFALDATMALRRAFAEWVDADVHQPVKVRSKVGYEGGEESTVDSSLGRELIYAMAHAIHHFALMAVMSRLLGLALPPHFGIAPSTVAHLRNAS